MITKLNNKAVANVTTLPVALGDMVLVSSATASGSATIDFTLGDYKEYQFYFVNIHPSVDGGIFQMNFSIDSGSNYNVTKTTTVFIAEQSETGTFPGLSYQTASDLAQSTSFQRLTTLIGNDNDQSGSGSMSVYNPSSGVYVKHFIATTQFYYPDAVVDFSQNMFTAGYANTTSALTNIRFQMSSGNIDAGKILMFGIN